MRSLTFFLAIALLGLSISNKAQADESPMRVDVYPDGTFAVSYTHLTLPTIA